MFLSLIFRWLLNQHYNLFTMSYVGNALYSDTYLFTKSAVSCSFYQTMCDQIWIDNAQMFLRLPTSFRDTVFVSHIHSLCLFSHCPYYTTFCLNCQCACCIWHTQHPHMNQDLQDFLEPICHPKLLPIYLLQFCLMHNLLPKQCCCFDIHLNPRTGTH
jgi:hypothetical protein